MVDPDTFLSRCRRYEGTTTEDEANQIWREDKELRASIANHPIFNPFYETCAAAAKWAAWLRGRP